MTGPVYGIAKVHEVGSVEDRLALIAKQVDVSVRDPWTRALALEIVSQTPQHGDGLEAGEITSVFYWVKNNIQYRQDPRDYDLYATAKRTVQLGGGDCDDVTILVTALLSNLGYRIGAKTISPDGKNWHIYPVVAYHTKSNPKLICTLDTTQPDSAPGWEPPMAYRRKEIRTAFAGGEAFNEKVRG